MASLARRAGPDVVWAGVTGGSGGWEMESMAELTLSARLHADGLDPGSWANGPGDVYAAHRHGYDKVLVCVEGSIIFGLPASGASIELRTGDRLDLPAGVDHSAVVGSAGVTCLEAHLPAGRLGREPLLRRAGSW